MAGVRAAPRTGRDALTRAEAQERARLIADPTYAVALDLDSGDETFGCVATIHFRSTQVGATTFIDFTPAAVEAIDLNGVSLGPDVLQDGRIVLKPLAATNTLRVVARCEYSRTGSGMYHFCDPTDGNVYCYTDFEPREAHHVYPCFDQPDVKGTFEFTVKARPGWRVVSNAAAVEEPAGAAGGLWRFPRTRTLPTYVTAICAGPYHAVRDRHRTIDLGIYCRRSLAPYLDPEEIFEITKRGFDFFEELFAYPYAFGKYDQVFVPEYNSGAMENAGCITHNEYMIFRSRVTEQEREDRAATILHELAHMWFGDLVTMRWWDDLWLNESFATYMGQLALVRATRFTQAWTTFAKTLKPWAYRQDQLPTTHPIVADVADTESARTNFDGISYAKGASVLKQLVAWVGEEAFIAGVRAYFQRYEYRNADLSAFLSALAEASGRDLEAWAHEWLERPGVNTLSAKVEAAASGQTIAGLAVEQTAPPEWPTLRSHRIVIGGYEREGEALVRKQRVELDIAGARTLVAEMRGQRLPGLLLVNDEDLTFSKIRLDAGSWRTVRAHLARLDNPLARTLCWTAAWEELRDAVMPARDYLQLVLANIHGERDIGVVQSLLSNCLAAINVYGDPTRREEALLRYATAARAALERAEPGSDLQLTWLQAFIGAARSDEHVGFVRGLLDGTQSVPGLAVDTDLRWHIVHALAASGAADEDLIIAELARDPTDTGGRRAAAAQAARPSAAAKAEAWAAITGERSEPLALTKARMRGFLRYDQVSLMVPYVAAYFAELPAMWVQRDPEVAMTFARAMYPTPVMSAELVRMTAEFLAAKKPPPHVRRYLLEGSDDVRRALRARALDRAGEVV